MRRLAVSTLAVGLLLPGTFASVIAAETGSTITGRILLEGNGPLGGVEVAAYPLPFKLGPNPPVTKAQSDANGNYRLEGLAPGTYRVEPTAGSEKWDHESSFILRVKDGQTHSQDLVAVPRVTVIGQVVDEQTGKPLRGLRIDCTVPKPDGRGGRTSGAYTDREGRFLIRTRPGKAQLQVWAPLKHGLTPPLDRRYAFRGPLNLQPGQTQFALRYDAERLNQPLPSPDRPADQTPEIAPKK
jgi:hypothetical protein